MQGTLSRCRTAVRSCPPASTSLPTPSSWTLSQGLELCPRACPHMGPGKNSFEICRGSSPVLVDMQQHGLGVASQDFVQRWRRKSHGLCWGEGGVQQPLQNLPLKPSCSSHVSPTHLAKQAHSFLCSTVMEAGPPVMEAGPLVMEASAPAIEACPLVIEGESPVMEAGPPGDSEAGVLRAHPALGRSPFISLVSRIRGNNSRKTPRQLLRVPVTHRAVQLVPEAQGS